MLYAILMILPISLAQSESSTKKITLTKSNTILLNDVIDSDLVPSIIAKARELDSGMALLKSKKPIYVVIRSPGGEVQLGLEMLDVFKGLDRKVDTITIFGASMAFQTAQQLGRRYIVKNGVLMSHRATGGVSGEFGGQHPSQTDNRKSFLESRIDEMDKETVARTNGKQTLESYQKAYVSELWVTGQQAVDKGYADEIVTVQCDKTLSGTTTKSILLMGQIKIDFDVDNCPLNSTPTNFRVSKMSTNKGDMSLSEFLMLRGEFGVQCLSRSGYDSTKLCATDTNLTLDVLNSFKYQVKAKYENVQDNIVPYRF